MDGFDEMGMYIILYNHPYYPRHMEALGYGKEVDWIEFQIKIAGRNERVAQIARAVEHRLRLHTRQVKSKKEVKPYLRPVFELVNEAYKPLFGTVPLTDRQIDFYVKQFFPLIDIRLISLVFNEDEKLVAFGLALPSLADGVRKSDGRLFPFGIFRILRALKATRILDLYLIAVSPDYQGKGVNAFIIDQLQDNIVGRFDIAETGPELELNRKVQTQWRPGSIKGGAASSRGLTGIGSINGAGNSQYTHRYAGWSHYSRGTRYSKRLKLHFEFNPPDSCGKIPQPLLANPDFTLIPRVIMFGNSPGYPEITLHIDAPFNPIAPLPSLVIILSFEGGHNTEVLNQTVLF